MFQAGIKVSPTLMTSAHFLSTGVLSPLIQWVNHAIWSWPWSLWVIIIFSPLHFINSMFFSLGASSSCLGQTPTQVKSSQRSAFQSSFPLWPPWLSTVVTARGRQVLDARDHLRMPMIARGSIPMAEPDPRLTSLCWPHAHTWLSEPSSTTRVWNGY